MCWNCRGLGNPWTVQILASLVSKYKPNVLFIYETKLCSVVVSRRFLRLNTLGYFAVGAVGSSGGLAILLFDNIALDVVSFFNLHIESNILDYDGYPKWRFVGLYGFPNNNRRHITWQLIDFLMNKCIISCLIAGD